jgi:uncharacterized protein YdhG (YjbR/CyaY superfamily)
MRIEAKTPEEYIAQLPEERQQVMQKLREVIQANLPAQFEEAMSYGFIGYVVPHSVYPGGYHCKPSEPLPFMSIAAQKNFIAVYHMGIYASPELMEWFTAEYPKHVKTKLDMGKSCIRFKNIKTIPYALIGELVTKMTAEEWMRIYESQIKK